VLQKHCTKPVCHRSACRRVVQQCVGMGGFLGYARVSTAEQTAALQEDALRAAGCSRIWSDTAIGTRTDRPQLVAVFDHLRVGDTLVAPNSASPPRPTPAGSSCPTPATTHQETAAIRLRATRPRRPLRNQPRRWPPRRPLHQRPAPVAKSALVRPAHRPVHPDYQCRRARRRPATTSRHPRRRHRPAAHHRQILHTYGDRPERKSLSPDGPPTGPRTRGQLRRRPIRSAPPLTALIGKEGNHLLERATGEITDPTDYRTTFTNPDTDPCRQLVFPVLAAIRDAHGARHRRTGRCQRPASPQLAHRARSAPHRRHPPPAESRTTRRRLGHSTTSGQRNQGARQILPRRYTPLCGCLSVT